MTAFRKAAGPWGGALASRVLKDLENGWPPGLTLLAGEDAWHLERVLHAILEKLVPDPEDAFALTVIQDGRIEAGELVGRARSFGMFSPLRVVVVRDAGVIEGDAEALESFADDPPDKGYLLVRARKLDRKRKLHQALCKGRVLEFRRAESESELRDLSAAAQRLARDRGVSLGARAVGWLVEACQADLIRIASEIEKLAAWVGGGPNRSVPDDVVREVVSGSETMTGWELGDLLLARDRAGAMVVARRYANAGEEAIKIVGGLAWRARVMIEAKAMLESGARADAVVTSVRAWGYRDALLSGLERYTMPELLAFPARLLDADRALKSRQIGARAVLESLVSDLTAPAASGRERRR